MRPHSMRLRRTHTGFSLIELMIGLTIGLVMLSVLATVFDRTSGGRSDLDRVSRLVENSRFALDVIGDDVRHAGFYGTVLPPSDTVFTNTSPCDWNTADLTSLGWQPTLLPPQISGANNGVGRSDRGRSRAGLSSGSLTRHRRPRDPASQR